MTARLASAARRPSRAGLRARYLGAAARIEAALAPWLLPSLARLGFAGVLLTYYWTSAVTKLGTGPFSPSVGAYAQILPRKAEAVLYDPGQFSAAETLLVLAGTWAEFLLPLLIVLGLLTRPAALAMIGFVAVQSLTDIFGHQADAATIGSWFDAAPDGPILDQRSLWILLLLILVLRGPGPLSLDRLLGMESPAPR